LVLRLVTAAVLVLWPLHALERAIGQSLIPLYRTAIELLDDRFVVDEALMAQERSPILRFGVNLARPLEVAGKTVYPFGWSSVPPGAFMPGGELMPRGGSVPLGEYRVDCPLGEALVYGAWGLILSLAWPARRVKEIILRIAFLIPVSGVLLLADVPTAVLAMPWATLQRALDPHGLYGWVVWHTFMVGGGGVVLGTLAAGIAIGVGKRVLARAERGPAAVERDTTPSARLVLPARTAASQEGSRSSPSSS
jgi:hypothetical protein